MPLVLSGTDGVSGVDGTASNPAIEGTDSNTGIFYPAADTVAIGTGGTERVRVDSAGNTGFGVTPSAWSGVKAIEIASAGSGIYSFGATDVRVTGNSYWNGSAYKYGNTNLASMYVQNSGIHYWYNAPSGTAGNTITWTQAMTLSAAGDLGVGITSNTAGYRGQFVGDSAADNISVGVRNTNTTGFTRFVLGNNISVARFTIGYTGSTASAPFGASLGYLGTEGNEPFLFQTNGAERARITSSGFSKFSNTGTYANSTGDYHEFRSNLDGNTFVVGNTSTTTNTDGTIFIQNARNTTNNTYYVLSSYNTAAAAFKFRVADSGNVTNTNGSYGTIPSERRFKQDIVDASSQWDDIKNIRLRKYRMKADVEAHGDEAITQLGVIIDELEQVCPNLVEEHPVYEKREIEDENGNVTTEQVLVDTVKGWKTSIVHLKALKALQEAMTRIEALEAEVQALKGNA